MADLNDDGRPMTGDVPIWKVDKKEKARIDAEDAKKKKAKQIAESRKARSAWKDYNLKSW